MHTAIQGYFQILFSVDPQSIGGGIPYDDFYSTLTPAIKIAINNNSSDISDSNSSNNS